MKDDLLQLINAYGDARACGNALLQQWATHSLSTFLDACEVISIAREVDDVPGGSLDDAVPGCPMPAAAPDGAE